MKTNFNRIAGASLLAFVWGSAFRSFTGSNMAFFAAGLTVGLAYLVYDNYKELHASKSLRGKK